ncbi:hypothetical protein P7C70_g2713, partial [Phenoliferia sp. Uapishka_3]
MSQSASPPNPSLPFPSEILTHILHFAVAPFVDPLDRSHQLFTLSLVSRQLKACAYDVQYRDLRCRWTAGTALRLQRTLLANPNLGRAVRSFSATNWAGDAWITDREARDAERPDEDEDDLPEQHDFDEQGRYQYRLPLERWKATLSWKAAGNERWHVPGKLRGWDPPRFENVEELMEMVGNFPNLQTLSMSSFGLSNTCFDKASPSARKIVANLSSINLVNIAGSLHGLFAGHESKSLALAITGEPSWVDRTPTLVASPTSLSLIGRYRAQELPWISTLFTTDILQELSFDLHLTQKLDEKTFMKETGAVEVFDAWITYLKNTPNLRCLRIRLGTPDGLDISRGPRPDSTLPGTTQLSPLPIDQARLGDHLINSSLRNLSIEWWPTRTLLARLPSTLETLEIGTQYPYDEDPQFEAEFQRELIERWDLARAASRALRHLPLLRVVALPFGGGGMSSAGDRTLEELEEFEERRVELEAVGYVVRRRAVHGSLS